MRGWRGLLAFSMVVAGASICSAHEPPGVTYYAFQFPAHAVPVMDGDLSDWNMVPDTYWLTLVKDFQETVRGIGTNFDLADINVKNIVAWNKETNRVYSMASVVDDYLHNSRPDPSSYNYDDDWHFVIDADHSGGDMYADDWPNLPEDERRQLFYTTGQLYQTHVPPIDGYWSFMYIEATGWWLTDGKVQPYPEYLQIGWSRTGETNGPGSYTYEIKATPWLRLDFSGPGASTIVPLEEGKIIHIGFLYKDYDVTEGKYEGSYDFPPVHNIWRNASLLADFELMPVEEGLFPVAVETDTWGRIKSTFLLEE